MGGLPSTVTKRLSAPDQDTRTCGSLREWLPPHIVFNNAIDVGSFSKHLLQTKLPFQLILLRETVAVNIT